MTKAYPIIEVKKGILTIRITANQLKFAVENNPQATYKVLDEHLFLNHFAANLEEYQTQNGVETGLTALQELFDKVVDETYENASEAIIDTEEQ